MALFSAIIVAIALGYFIVQFKLARSWDALSIEHSDEVESSPGMVTVLVPARNEADHINSCLQSLLEQDFDPNSFEVICLDNHSEDETAAIADRIHDQRLSVISLADFLPEQTTFKKEAIAYGVGQARGEFVLILDADCTVGPKWLATMIRHLRISPYEYISGPVCLMSSRDHWLSIFERLEFSGLQVVTGGGLQSGILLSSNGANHGFRKSSFVKVDGYRGNDHIRSGDDLFLLHKLSESGASYRYVKAQDAIATTPTASSTRGLLAQRKRWAAKSGNLAHAKTKVISLLVFCTVLGLWVSILLAILAPGYWWLPATVILLKVAGDSLVLQRGLRFFQHEYSTAQYVLAHVIQPIYVLWVGVSSLLPGQQSWKGREV